MPVNKEQVCCLRRVFYQSGFPTDHLKKSHRTKRKKEQGTTVPAPLK